MLVDKREKLLFNIETTLREKFAIGFCTNPLYWHEVAKFVLVLIDKAVDRAVDATIEIINKEG